MCYKTERARALDDINDIKNIDDASDMLWTLTNMVFDLRDDVRQLKELPEDFYDDY